MTTLDLPLYPSSAVLFPGGSLQLQITEQRYLEMVRNCAKAQLGFGICLLLQEDKPQTTVPAAIGTLANIVDFYTRENGLLGLQAQGMDRFRVETIRVRDNGLIHGKVRLLPKELVVSVPPELSLLVTILDRLLEKVDGIYRNAPREQFDDAGWVGFRLAELLPLQPRERQYLLQLVDPIERLQQLLRYLPRFQAA